MSGTFLNSSSTYDSLTSAPTSNSSSSSTKFATSATKGLAVAPLRPNKNNFMRLLTSPTTLSTSGIFHAPRKEQSTTLASPAIATRNTPVSAILTVHCLVRNSGADDSSLYLDDDHDHEHDESTQLSTPHRHLEGGEEEEDEETGIGLSLLGALAMDDDEDDESGGKDGHGLGDREGESTATGGSTSILWTQYTPSISASPTVEHEVDDNVPHALSENKTAQDDSMTQDEPEQHLKRESEIGDEVEEDEDDEDEDVEGYWTRASDIYDDSRYSRYNFSSKRMSTISVKSKVHMSILSGGGKVPPQTDPASRLTSPVSMRSHAPAFRADGPAFRADGPAFRADGPAFQADGPSRRPSVSSASSPSQIDRANIPSTYTNATASVYSRPSFESTSSADPGSPVSLEHALHGPVDGPEVRLRPPVARQFPADYESTRTVSTYSVQTLSPLSAQFPQVPTGVPSRLRVTNADMEDESEGEGEGLGGEKTPPHAMNPVSPLLYASFGAKERYSCYTEETEMQSSGYSESDDGHASHGSSVASTLRMRTESGREQRVGLGMCIVVDDDGEDLGVEGDTSFVSSEAGTASTGHTVTPVSPLPLTTGAPSTLMPRASAALTPGTPSPPTPGASLAPVTSSALSPVAPPSPGAPSALTPGNPSSGQGASPAPTLRPRQPKNPAQGDSRYQNRSSHCLEAIQPESLTVTAAWKDLVWHLSAQREVDESRQLIFEHIPELSALDCTVSYAWQLPAESEHGKRSSSGMMLIVLVDRAGGDRLTN
ncbi:hypothetical protein EDB19DRAFT_1829397 [Suillus lakei]|nr:hypothetical protein EDB19DRAFT_1829397 [Suillus lakei]